MKKILYLLLIVFLACCKNPSINKPKGVTAISMETKRLIRDTLFQSYYKQYQQDISIYGGDHVSVDSTNGSIQLRVMDQRNEQSVSPETIIPAIKDFIEGDLNNDGLNDLVISVYYNQGSRPRLTNYCYITQNNELKFYNTFSIHDLGICQDISDTSGRFFPQKIENGRLIGQTDCLQSGDPGCCPSLELITYFKFDNGFKFEKHVAKDSSRVRR